MASVGKVALLVILALGAVTGIMYYYLAATFTFLCYYFVFMA